MIGDCGKDFVPLKSKVTATAPQTVEYRPLLAFKSAESNAIIQHSGKPPVYS